VKFGYDWVRERLRPPILHGLGMLCNIPVVTADTAVIEFQALVNRALPGTIYDPDEWCTFRLWLEVYPAFPGMPRSIRGAPFDQWNARFPKGRRNAQAKALESYRMNPNDDAIRRSCVRQTFIKREKLLKLVDGEVEDYDPRVIQGVGHLANCILGPWMYQFSKFLATSWSGSNEIVYAAGMSAEALGAWLNASHPTSLHVEVDYSRFDSTISVDALDCERDIYVRHGCPDQALIVLEQQRQPRGYTKNGHTYSMVGSRCSGDPNTSCGNSMINGLTMRYAMSLAAPEAFVRILVMGDDSVVEVRGELNATTLQNTLETLGFKPKINVRTDPDFVEFCSGRFWAVGNGRIWGPKPGRQFAKLGWACSPVHDGARWLRGVMLGVNVDTAFIPVLREYVEKTLSLLQGVKGAPLSPDYRFHAGAKHCPTSETYTQFFKIYDLTPRDLDSFRASLKAVTALNTLVEHHVLDVLNNVDNQ